MPEKVNGCYLKSAIISQIYETTGDSCESPVYYCIFDLYRLRLGKMFFCGCGNKPFRIIFANPNTLRVVVAKRTIRICVCI